jgi:putative membrane-bound dehydrogenase-like protein
VSGAQLNSYRWVLASGVVALFAVAWLITGGDAVRVRASAETVTGDARSNWALPDGFAFEKVTGPPLVRYPMFATFDDRRRLFVAESSGGNLYWELDQQSRRCRIVVLEDTNGDGVFDHAQTFADSLAFPMGLVWHRGRLYVADPPHVLVLADTNGDGRADRREIILTGFGHESNGSLHGLTVGPDGWLYMTVGWPDSYRIQRSDGSWLQGVSGGILRSRLDGSDPEVVALGFENPIELVWTETGELLTTLNWYMEPADGLRDALVHVVEGGVYPYHAWRETAQPLPTTGPWLPAVVLRPAVAHSGMARYQGSAFPERHRGIFVAEYNTRRVVRYTLERKGSSFGAAAETFLAHDHPAFHPSDVVEADDGSLLVIDTGVWYAHCPLAPVDAGMEGGGIWRIRYAPAVTDSPFPEPPRVWRERSMDELVVLLADVRPAVRRAAGTELETRGHLAVGPLDRLITGGSHPEAAVRAIWILGRMDEAAALLPLRAALGSGDASIAAAAARALGGRGDLEAAPQLAGLLAHQHHHVRLAAAEALSRIGAAVAGSALIAALAAPDLDRILEHTLAFALYRSADTGTLRAALGHEHPRVQAVALYLLNEPRHDGLSLADVTARAAAADAGLREAAREVLRRRPEWAEHAVALMRHWSRPGASAEEHERVAEYASALSHQPPVAGLVANLVVGGDRSGLRRLLIQGMTRHTGEVPAEWSRALGAVIAEDEALRDLALETVAALGLHALDGQLIALLEDERQPAELRTRVLEILAARHPERVDRHIGFLLDRLAEEPGPARMRAAALLAGATLRGAELARLAAIVADDAAVHPELVLEAAERSPVAPPGPLLDYLAARIGAGWQPDRARLAGLAQRAEPEQGDRARRLVLQLERAEERQAALWARYRPLLRDGDPGKGRELFFARAGCAECHRAEAVGGTGGPDLSRIGLVRSGESILRSLLFPNSTTAQGYDAWVVRTADGRALIGMLGREPADELVLRDISGRLTRVPVSEVVASQPLGRSLMPEGLLGLLSDDEARDLLAYLQSLE